MTDLKKNRFKSLLKNPHYGLRSQFAGIKSKTKLDYYLLNGFSFLPDTVRIDLTYKCNLRCRLCFEFGKSSDELSQKKSNEEINFDTLKNFLLQIKYFSPTIYLSGGEPFLYSRIIELLSFLRDKRFYSLVNTNGALLEQFAEETVKTGTDRLVISIDGPEEIHNQNRGNTFKKILMGANKLNDIKKSLNSFFPLIRINCLITPFNYSNLKDVVAVAEGIGADSLSFQHPMFSTDKESAGRKNKHNNSIDILGYVFQGDISAESVISEIENIKKISSPLKIYFYPSVPENKIREYYNDIAYPFEKRCYTSWRKLMINPSGDIGPCVHFPLGNIAEMPFQKLWNGRQYRNFRKKIKEKGLFNDCFRCCLREY